MKAVSQTYKDNIKKLGKQIDSIITYEIDGVQYELGVEQLNSVTPHYEGNILKSVMKQLDIVSRIDIPLGTIINCQFGIKVADNEVQDYRDNYEYIDLGNYIVYSSEKQEADNTYKIICYDKMLNSMVDYVNLNITYPITIRNYLNAICNHLQLVFANSSDNFVNYNKQIPKELYLDSDGNTLNYTFRDVLDELAQVTASTICINDDDEIEVRYINNTNDTINEEYLKDINVNFKEQYGPINTISFKRSADSDVISLSRPIDLSDDLKKEISISDNQILNQDNRSEYLEGILNELYGLNYFLNDFTSTGLTFYELCDKYNVSITKYDEGGNMIATSLYPCVMFNDEIQITQGIVENVHTDMPQDSKTNYNLSTKDDREMGRAVLIVDKASGQISSKVGKDEIISTINQSAEQVQIDASKISLTGKTIALTGDNINITGNNFSVDSSGNMAATSGTIGGFHIEQKELWNKISETGYSYEDVYECSRYVVTYNSTWSNVPSDVKLMYKEKFGFNNENDLKAKWDVAPANNPNGSITVADVMYMLNNLLDLGASGIKLIAGGNNVPASIQLSGPYSDEAIILSADGSITLNKKDYSNGATNDTLKIDATGIKGGDFVVNSIRSKNMIDKSTIVAGSIDGTSTTIRLNTRQILWLPVGTYTCSCNNITSPFRYGIQVQNIGIPPLSSWPSTFIYDSGWQTNTSFTFTITNAGWCTLMISKENNATLTTNEVSDFNFQLEEGSTATTYYPYQNLDGASIENGFDNTQMCYYTKFSDGTLIKFGYYTIGSISSGGYTHTFNMEVPFINNEYSVITTKRMGGTANFSNLVDSVSIISQSSFSIITWCNSGSFGGGNNSYLCIGRWK